MAATTELTEGELRFCVEYAADPNATQAYCRAFPNVKETSASVLAVRLLAKVKVRAHVRKLRAGYARQVGVDALRTLRETATVAFADIGDLFEPDPDNGGLPKPRDWKDVSPLVRKAVQSVKINRRRLRNKKDSTQWEVESLEYKLFPKLDAIKTLCQHLGLTHDAPAIREALEELRRRQAQPPPPAGGGGGG